MSEHFDVGRRQLQQLASAVALSRAINYLGAQTINERYVWLEPLDDFWHSTTAKELEKLGIALIPSAKGAQLIQAHATWLRGGHQVRLPAWWSLERQCAYRRTTRNGKVSLHFNPSLHWLRRNYAVIERITADLETGEEIPC